MGVNVGDSAVRKAFKATRDKLNESKGLICFTKNWKNPLMWGHYASLWNLPRRLLVSR
jgi:hypothetical protein